MNTSALQAAHLDRLSALVDAASARADDFPALFDFVIAIADLWERLDLRDGAVEAQLADTERRAQLEQATRGELPPDEQERLAFYALRTLAALQSVVEGWRRRPAMRGA